MLRNAGSEPSTVLPGRCVCGDTIILERFDGHDLITRTSRQQRWPGFVSATGGNLAGAIRLFGPSEFLHRNGTLERGWAATGIPIWE